MDLSGHISDLIVVATEMRNQPGVNKKALNKTIARLEEAQLWSKEVMPGKVNGVPPAGQAVHGSTENCICPPGARDNSCPAQVHKA